MANKQMSKNKGTQSAAGYSGRGIYTVAEAARYTGTKASTLNSWFNSSNKALLDSDFSEVGNQRRISFLDLIDSLVVSRMRKERISMPHIREARDVLAAEWETEHPFCRHDFCVDISEKRIIQIIEASNGSKALVDALRKDSQMELVIADYLRKVAYDQKTLLANRWDIAGDVSIEPEVILGKPAIKGTRIPTSTIATQYYAYDEDEAPVAELYEISESEVIHAVKFENEHGFVKKAA